jgi:hypothetical protein
VDVEISAAVSELEVNVPLEASAFTVEVPAGTKPLTLEELREAGPLRDAAPGGSK